jgi:hypothetical protein
VLGYHCRSCRRERGRHGLAIQLQGGTQGGTQVYAGAETCCPVCCSRRPPPLRAARPVAHPKEPASQSSQSSQSCVQSQGAVPCLPAMEGPRSTRPPPRAPQLPGLAASTAPKARALKRSRPGCCGNGGGWQSTAESCGSLGASLPWWGARRPQGWLPHTAPHCTGARRLMRAAPCLQPLRASAELPQDPNRSMSAGTHYCLIGRAGPGSANHTHHWPLGEHTAAQQSTRLACDGRRRSARGAWLV